MTDLPTQTRVPDVVHEFERALLADFTILETIIFDARIQREGPGGLATTILAERARLEAQAAKLDRHEEVRAAHHERVHVLAEADRATRFYENYAGADHDEIEASLADVGPRPYKPRPRLKNLTLEEREEREVRRRERNRAKGRARYKRLTSTEEGRERLREKERAYKERKRQEKEATS